MVLPACGIAACHVAQARRETDKCGRAECADNDVYAKGDEMKEFEVILTNGICWVYADTFELKNAQATFYKDGQYLIKITNVISVTEET